METEDMSFNMVHPSFRHGENFQIGCFNHIYADVEVGDNVQIRSYVELRSGTVMGDDVYVDSGVKSSGKNKVGDRVRLRYDSILARGVVIEDDVFISPQLMTENLNHKGKNVGGAKIGLGDWSKKTQYRVFIGTNVTLAAGIEICPDTIIGTKANVRKSIKKSGVYIGNPSRRIDDPKRVENIIRNLQQEMKNLAFYDQFEPPSEEAKKRVAERGTLLEKRTGDDAFFPR